MICLFLPLWRGPDVLFWGQQKGSEQAPCLCGGSRMNRMLIKKPRIKPRIQNFKSTPLPSAALMYFLFLLHCWPYISRSHLVSNRVTLFRSPLSAGLLLSHSSRALRCADVPGNKASSSESSSATALLEQVGEPRRQRRRQLWRWYLILPRTI